MFGELYYGAARLSPARGLVDEARSGKRPAAPRRCAIEVIRIIRRP